MSSSLNFADTANTQTDHIQHYYKFHAAIYDLTRWSFLFGRKGLIRQLKAIQPHADHMLEVGCGTGYNLQQLFRIFPESNLMGLDVSREMLDVATKRFPANAKQVKFLNKPYEKGMEKMEELQDAIIFSYSLTMINPHWEELIQQAKEDLKPGGVIAVVDFYNSRFNWFKKHMSNHHVRMDGHILPVLEKNFTPLLSEQKKAYAGVWEYFIFIGKRQ